MATKVRKGMACVVVVVVGAGRLSKLPTTDYWLLTAYSWLLATYYYYLLQPWGQAVEATYYWLLSTYYWPLTTYYYYLLQPWG
jgi:hypothetical protein